MNCKIIYNHKGFEKVHFMKVASLQDLQLNLHNANLRNLIKIQEIEINDKYYDINVYVNGFNIHTFRKKYLSNLIKNCRKIPDVEITITEQLLII